MALDPLPKVLIAVGVFLVVLGFVWQLGWLQALRLGHLPGDIRIERENFSFYFPLTTCVLVSGLFMLVSWLFRK